MEHEQSRAICRDAIASKNSKLVAVTLMSVDSVLK